MRALIAGFLLLVALPAYSQTLPTCAPLSTGARPWNEVRLTWIAPTRYVAVAPSTTGDLLPAGTALTYVVYRRATSGLFTAQCQTTTPSASMTSQPIGIQTYTVTARTATSPDSSQSAPGFKDVAEPAVEAPTGLTIVSTRIDPDSWTCRDALGNVLSRHERQDKAQESCTNLALAHVGVPFEMRPSGYRIVAR